MNDLPTTRQAGEQQPPNRNRPKKILFCCGFIGLMMVFFLGGYYLTGMYRSASAPSTPARVDISDEEEWGQLPPPRKKVKATVEVNEIAPELEVSPEAVSSPESTEALTASSEPTDPETSGNEPSPTPSVRTPEPQPKPAPVKDAKRYIIQVGVYAEKTNAEIVSANLADHGYASSIRQVHRNGETHFQVTVGEPRDKARAEALASELRKAGREVTINTVD